jgi:hypothetical protein
MARDARPDGRGRPGAGLLSLAPWRGLHKWYFDCATDEGEAVIAYVGRVALGRLTVPYFELLAIGPGGCRRWRRLSSRPAVSRDGETLELAAPALGVRGRWAGAGAALDVRLHGAPEGEIRWRCHQPGGTCELMLPDGRRVVGSGYAEELETSLPPWALPFRELRWGRFGGSGRSVVWIDWRGGREARWLFVDGAPVEGRRVETTAVEWGGGCLEIEPGVVVREAALGRTLAGPLAPLLPSRVRDVRETKWLCPARLHGGREASPVRGWVIHEVVRWP